MNPEVIGHQNDYKCVMHSVAKRSKLSIFNYLLKMYKNC